MSGPLPRSPLALVGGLVGLQGLGLVLIAAFYLVELAVATASDVIRALVTAPWRCCPVRVCCWSPAACCGAGVGPGHPRW